LAESPEWLANQGDLRAAVDVMRSHHNLDVELAPVEDRDPTAASAEPVKGGRWSGFAELFAPRYRVRTIVALCVSVFSTFGYNAVAYGTPLIITTLFHQTPLITIVSSLIINLGFGTIGGLLGMSIVNRFGTRRLTLYGFAIQALSLGLLAIVGIPNGALVLVSVAMLSAFVFAQAGGPGANLMNYATLSYPTRLRGIGIGFNQSVLRAFSIVSLIMFPILAASLGTGVFWIVACAPLAGAIAVGIVKWDPTAQAAEAESGGSVALALSLIFGEPGQPSRVLLVLVLTRPQMTGGQGSRLRLVASGDRLEELSVLGGDDIEIIVLAQLPAHPRVEQRSDLGQQLIARELGDDGVELGRAPVSADDLSGLRQLSALEHRGLEAGQPLTGVPLGRQLE